MRQEDHEPLLPDLSLDSLKEEILMLLGVDILREAVVPALSLDS